jgi:transposase
MQFNFFVGIDVSKDTLDFSLVTEGKVQMDFCVENSSKGIKTAINELTKQSLVSLENTLFCMEQTGLYNNHVTSTLYSLKAFIWVERAIHIKRSSGLQRGKSDKVDAQRIALFAYRNQDQKKLWEPKRIIIQQLKKLTTVRERLLLTAAQLQKPIQESKKFDSKEVFNVIKNSCSKSIKAIKADLKEVEKRIKELIKSDCSLKHLFDLITSVSGIGPVIACEMIITTNEFKNISDPKRYACYAGVVPFEYSSGSSIRGKNRISHFANKNIKRLLHLAALSIIRKEGEFRSYWLRKMEEGKHKMVILNAMRNKLIQRVFAVVKRGSKYEKTYTNSLA